MNTEFININQEKVMKKFSPVSRRIALTAVTLAFTFSSMQAFAYKCTIMVKNERSNYTIVSFAVDELNNNGSVQATMELTNSVPATSLKTGESLVWTCRASGGCKFSSSTGKSSKGYGNLYINDKLICPSKANGGNNTTAKFCLKSGSTYTSNCNI